MIVSDAEVNALIERWIGGDDAAAAELCRRYYTRVVGFAIKLYGHAMDAEDVAQQAFLQGLEGIKAGVRPDRFTQWILGVVRNAGRTQLRREDDALHVEVEMEDGSRRSALTELARVESKEVFKKIIGSLPPDQRSLLEQRYLSGETRQRMAFRLRISTEALDRRIEKAMERIRGALSRHFTTFVFNRIQGADLTLEAIEELRPTFREAFTLRHRDGLSVGEIAVRLGIAHRTVEGRLKYAYERLRLFPDGDYRQVWGAPEAPPPDRI